MSTWVQSEVWAERVEEIKLPSPADAVDVAGEEEAASAAVRNGASAAFKGEAVGKGWAAVASVLRGAAALFASKPGAAFFPLKIGTMTNSTLSAVKYNGFFKFFKVKSNGKKVKYNSKSEVPQ